MSLSKENTTALWNSVQNSKCVLRRALPPPTMAGPLHPQIPARLHPPWIHFRSLLLAGGMWKGEGLLADALRRFLVITKIART